MSTPRKFFETVIDGTDIYVIGGVNSASGVLRSVEKRDTGGLIPSWTTIAQMRSGRTDFKAVLVGNKIYAIGGRTTNGYTGSVETLDLSMTNPTWQAAGSLNTARGLFTISVNNGVIYIAGGIMPNGSYTTSVESLDTTLTNPQWQTRDPNSTPTYGSYLVNNGNRLFHFGGGNSFADNFSQYLDTSITGNSWKQGFLMNTFHASSENSHAININSILYVVGGNSQSLAVESLDLNCVSPLAYSASNAGVIVGSGSIGYTGGSVPGEGMSVNLRSIAPSILSDTGSIVTVSIVGEDGGVNPVNCTTTASAGMNTTSYTCESITLSEGINTITTTIVNALGNLTTETYSFFNDTTRPLIESIQADIDLKDT
jgi:hypothetical protein